MTATLRVVVADDHAGTRSTLRRTLERHGIDVVAEAADATSAAEAAVEHNPDVVLLDINMPGSGVEAAAAIAEAAPSSRIIMLTVSRADDDVVRAVRAGASGYLLKDSAPERIVSALHAVAQGEAVLPATMLQRLMADVDGRDARRREAVRGAGGDAVLTDRERDVLRMLGEGLTTAEIAGKLFVAKVTVRSHVAAILRKLRVRDREEAVRLFKGVEEDQHPQA